MGTQSYADSVSVASSYTPAQQVQRQHSRMFLKSVVNAVMLAEQVSASAMWHHNQFRNNSIISCTTHKLFVTMNLPMRNHISQLIVAELLDHMRGNLQIPRANSKQKELLLDYIFANGSPDLFAQLSDAAANKQTLQVQKREGNLAARKRKRNENQNERRTTARLEEIVEEDQDTAKFLELPTEERVKECYRQFYKGMSNAAVEMAVCAVCAREAGVQSDQVTVQRLADLPNSYQLIPHTPHAAHDLFEGRLLELSGVSGGDVKVCGDCLKELRNESDKPPALSLANNLWIGCIPWELQVLTFPEQLLIALLYPRVYVFKLFPNDVHYRPEDSMLQRGMRGTVST